MGKYYNTHTVPLVDYVVDFPFDSLLKAKMYKQQRTDKVQDTLTKGKEKLLGLRVIKGKQNDQGVYQKSGDEEYRDQKITEYNTLIDEMKGKDLSQNYGLIKQKIGDIWDPHMVDIAASRQAYDAEEKQIQKWRGLGTWNENDYKDPHGWDTAEMGEYRPTNKPFVEWRSDAEKLFDGMQKDKGIDPRTGLQLAGIDPTKIREQARRSAGGFYADPKGQRAADNWIASNAGAVESWRAEGLSEGEVRLKATEEALYNIGMERHNKEVTPWAKGKGASGTGSQTTDPNAYEMPYNTMVEQMIGNQQKETTLGFTKNSPQLQEVMNSPMTSDISGNWMSINPGQSNISIGSRFNSQINPYFGVGTSGVMGALKVGDVDKNLDHLITPSDVATQQRIHKLLIDYQNQRETLDGWEEYSAIQERMQTSIDVGKQRKQSYLAKPDFEEKELTEQDISNQNAVIEGKQGGLMYPENYTGIGTKPIRTRQAGSTVAMAPFSPKIKMTFGEDIVLKENYPNPSRTIKAGEEVEMTADKAQQYLEEQGRWDYGAAEDNLIAQRQEQFKPYKEQIDRHAKILKSFKEKGMPNPKGVYAQSLLTASRAHDENNEGEALKAAGLSKAILGNKIFQNKQLKFAPDSHKNYFIANGKTYVSGKALLSQADLDLFDQESFKDETGKVVIEDTKGNVYDWSDFSLWVSGQIGTPTLSQALKDYGVVTPSNRLDKEGNPLFEMPLSMEAKVGKGEMDRYNRASGVTPKQISELQGLANERLSSITLKAQADQMTKDATSWNNNYKNFLTTKYSNAIDDISDYPIGGDALTGLYVDDSPEKAAKRENIKSSEDLLDNLIVSYNETILDALNNVDEDGNSDPWLGAQEAKEKLTPHLEAIQKYRSGDRSVEARANAKKATEELSNQYGFLIDPIGFAPEGLGATETTGGTEELRKKNFEEYAVEEIIDPKLSEAVRTNNITEYKRLGTQKAIQQGNVLYTPPTNNEQGKPAYLSIKKGAQIPYVQKEMKTVLNTISAELKKANVPGLAISGLYRTPEYNASLRDPTQGKISVENSFHLEGLAADFSLATPQNREAVEKLKTLIASGAVSAPAGYKIDVEEHGSGSNIHFHIELEPLKA